MKKLNQAFPLIIESHPETYNGPPFLTLIRYNGIDSINIVDNVINNEIVAYSIDLCPKEFDYKPEVTEKAIINIAYDWYDTARHLYPVSIAFSRYRVSAESSRILRRYQVDYVTRVIGPLPTFAMDGPFKVKKRKRKPIPKGIEVVKKSLR